MVRIGEAHPHKPVFIGIERIEVSDRAIRNPVGVIELARTFIVLGLNRFRVAQAEGILRHVGAKHGIELIHDFWMVLHQPAGVVQHSARTMRRQLHVIEPAMGTETVLHSHAVFLETQLKIEERLEMRFADQCGAIVFPLFQQPRHGRRIHRQRHAVHPHAMRRNILAGDHCRTRRHADDILRMTARVVDPVPGEGVDGGRSRDLLSVHT